MAAQTHGKTEEIKHENTTHNIANKGFSGMRRFVARFNFSCNLIGNHPQSLTGHIVNVVYNLKKKEVLKLNFIIFLIGPIICFGQVDFSNKEYWQQKILNDNSLPIVRQSLNEEFTEFNDITRIPEDLIKILETWKGSKISFANPNEEYNKTDVVDDLLPNRQLKSIYLNLNHAFVLYNHGGFGFHKHIIWCEFDEEKIIDIWICNYNTTITDISSIKAFLDNFTRTHKLSDGRLLRENYVCY